MPEKDGEKQVVLDSVYVELDPVLDGFEGALIEVLYRDNSYVLIETAVGTGNQLLRFTSTDAQLVHELLYECTSIASVRS